MVTRLEPPIHQRNGRLMPKKPTKGRPKAGEATRTVASRIPGWLADILDDIAMETRRKVSTEILIAIEDRVKALGKWPEGK